MFGISDNKRELIYYFKNVYLNAEEIKEFSISAVGDDKYNQHIQVWYRPIRTCGGYDPNAGTLEDFINRASKKINNIRWVEISIAFHDIDGDYRSFTHKVCGNKDSYNMLKDLIEIQSNLRLPNG